MLLNVLIYNKLWLLWNHKRNYQWRYFEIDARVKQNIGYFDLKSNSLVSMDVAQLSFTNYMYDLQYDRYIATYISVYVRIRCSIPCETINMAVDGAAHAPCRRRAHSSWHIYYVVSTVIYDYILRGDLFSFWEYKRLRVKVGKKYGI